jgi:translation initiation factor IF-3
MNGRPPGRFSDRRRPEQQYRINHRIRVPEIRVILDEEQLGIMPTHEALRLAEEKGLDLVEISPRAFPPVCRIMDFGKFKYEESKKKQQTRRKASTVETKEIKFRPKTEEHDMDFKVKHVRRFLEEGNKVRLAVVFRGREITHPQTGMAVLNRVVERCNDIATVEATPNMEGRRMIMVIERRAQGARGEAGATRRPDGRARREEGSDSARTAGDGSSAARSRRPG